MKSKSDIEFRVGLIILLMIIILAGSLYWLQGYRLERNSQRILVHFTDVGTLAVGDKVTVSGVNRGKVNDMTLGRGGVDVEILVYADVDLRSDATFRIRNMGVMGERYVAIDPGTDSLPFRFSDTAVGLYDTGIPEVMGALGEMVLELRELVSNLRTTVASDSTLRRFDRTVSNLERTTAGIADFMEDHDDHLDATVKNFLKASRDLQTMIADNKVRADSAFSRMDRASAGLEIVVGRLDTLSAAAGQLAEMLDSEEGSLQLMLQDRRLYDDLRKTVDDIDDLVADIRANPRKYINLKVEIF